MHPDRNLTLSLLTEFLEGFGGKKKVGGRTPKSRHFCRVFRAKAAVPNAEPTQHPWRVFLRSESSSSPRVLLIDYGLL